MSPRRAVALLLSTTLVAAVAAAGVVLAAAPAEAASAYRYWSYWYAKPSEGAWTYGQVGPGGHGVQDGSVEGWRFVVAAPNPLAPQPRTSPATAFTSLCGGTPRVAGKARVAVVVDFGTPADAPPGESRPAGVTGRCAVVAEGSNGLTALVKAGYVTRQNSSALVCGISGYPAHECGVVVKLPTPSPSPSASKPRPTATPAHPSGTPAPSATHAPSATATAGSNGTGGARPTPPSSASASTPSSRATSGPPAAPTPSASGSAVAIGSPPQPPGGSSSGTPTGLLIGGVLVLGLGAAAVLRGRGTTRRGRTQRGPA